MSKAFSRSIIFLLVAIMLLSLGTACGKKEQIESDKGEGEDTSLVGDNPEDLDGNEEIGKGDNGFPVEVIDALDRQIIIEEKPTKVASVAPNSTEILFSLGLGDQVIGVSEHCDYPEEALEKDKLGAFWEPNIELIVAADPDILFVGNKAPEDFINKIEDSGIKVVAFEGRNLQETYESIVNTGKVMGTEEAAMEIVDSMKKKVDEIEGKVESVHRPKTYFVISYGESGDFTAGSGSFIDEMITTAGGENVAGDIEQEWIEYSIEKLVENAPEIILATRDINPDGIKDTPGYKELDAIKEGKIVVLDDNLVTRAGPRIVEGLEEIAKSLHPDLFK